MQKYDLALENQISALKVREELLGDKSLDVSMSYDNIGSIYQEQGENDLALEYYLKSLNIKKEILGDRHKDVASSYISIGLFYFKTEEYDLALENYLTALKIYQDIFGEKHPDIAKTLNRIASVYDYQDDYNNALKYIQLGLIANLEDYNSRSNVNSIPIIRNYLNAETLLESLYFKSYVFNKLKNLIASYYNLQLCDTLITQISKTYPSQKDKMSSKMDESQVWQAAIQRCVELAFNPASHLFNEYFLSQAFYFSEKNKVGLLLEALSGQESLKFAGISDSLLQEEHAIKIDISFCEKKLAESPDTIIENKYRDQLFNRNRQYEELIARIEKEYPDYYDLKYATNNPSIKDIQSILDDKTAIRSYFVGDSSISIFTLTNKKLDVNNVPTIKNLNDSITWFRYGLTKTSPRMQENYRRIAFLLYQQLFPESAPIDEQIENLIIIPEGNLAIVPFESLLTSNFTGDINSYKEYPFLIKKYNISYSYSANLFYRTFSKQKSPSIEITKLNDWLAFAPVFNNSIDQTMVISTRELQKQLNWLKTDSLMTNRSMFDRNYITPLPATETETEAIFKLYDENNLKAKVLLHNNANEKFLKSGELEQYKVLHFATHGFVNSERPELSGLLLAQDTTSVEDGILYSGEIYNLKLNADLVVLSACETGLGKIQKGEGIIGLTRALLYAGAKNIIVSLWQVADESTSDLMVDFYKNSLENKVKSSYSEALRNAKLKMISEEKYAHPLFWSPFILIGK